MAQQLGRGAIGASGIAQLVRQHRQELVLAAVGQAQRFLGAHALERAPGTLRHVLDQAHDVGAPDPRQVVVDEQAGRQRAVAVHRHHHAERICSEAKVGQVSGPPVRGSRCTSLATQVPWASALKFAAPNRPPGRCRSARGRCRRCSSNGR
jgi:hypothetical protein